MRYILYCRKSTDTEDKQVLSLESQENELLEIARKQNLNVVKVLKESMSAKMVGRPVFNQMMKTIANGKADAILCWKLDRLARNMVDGGQVMDMLQNSFLKGIQTYESIHLPADNVLMLAVHFGMANQYSRDLSQNVKRGNRAKLERGEWPNRAPYGYTNDRITKQVVPDPELAHHVRRLFELYATGSYSLKQISSILYEEGMRTHTGKRLQAGNLHRIVVNPFHYGMMLRQGKYYEGKHQPLITKDLFDRAQDVLNGRLHPRPKTQFFHLRGFLKCANCECMITASKKKGHDYYYCTNGKGICDEQSKGYIRSERIDEFMAHIFDKLQFDEELVELAYQAAKERKGQETNYSAKNAEIIDKRLSEVRTAQSRLCDSFSAGNTPEPVYNVKMLALGNEEKSLIKQLKDIPKEPVLILEPIKEVFLTANRAKEAYLAATPEKKRIIVQNLLWNLSIKNREPASYQFKSPYDILARASKPTDFSTMWAERDSNPRRHKAVASTARCD